MENSFKISLQIQSSPKGADVAIVSTSESAAPGELSSFVLKSLDYDEGDLITLQKPIKEVGYAWTQKGSKSAILFIATVGSDSSKNLLRSNLRKALKEKQESLYNKIVWIPLMGTGVGSLSHRQSFDTIYKSLVDWKRFDYFPSEVIISAPDNIKQDDTKYIEELIKKLNPITPAHNGLRHALSTEASDSTLINKGYHIQGPIGYIYSKKTKGSIPLTQVLINSSNDYFYYLHRKNETFTDRDVSEEKIIGYISIDTKGNHRELMRYKRYVNNSLDHFYCTQPDNDKLREYNYERERADFDNKYLLTESGENVIPLYVYSNSPGIKLFSAIRILNTNTIFGLDEINQVIYDSKENGKPFGWLNLKQSDSFSTELLPKEITSMEVETKLIPDAFHHGGIVICYDNINKDEFYAIAKLSKVSRRKNGLTNLNIEFLYILKKRPSLDLLLKNDAVNKLNLKAYRKGILHPIDFLFQEIINTTELGGQVTIEVPTDSINIEDHDPTVKISNQSTKDKIPFHYDRVVEDDELGREPAAIAFADLIKDDIFTQNLDHAFMVHLQGEWGAGKSTFLNLIKNQLNSGNKNWVIVNYNAWKNQHLSPPWWTFLDQIFQQAKTDKCFDDKKRLRRRERSRRIKYYTAWQKLLALALTTVFIGLILYFGNTILDFFVNLFSNGNINGEAKGLTVDVFAKLIISIGSLVGLIYSISKFLTIPFFMTSSKDATSFIARTSDPLKRIKDHFKQLVADINKNHQLAIFIDDIDRCDRTFLVELLEGIQTLFKEEKVLYLVAGDKQWISKAFQNQYKEFDTEQDTDQNHLGDLFIRKAFQLSIRMPQVSDAKKKKFWDHILGIKAGSDNEPREIKELDQKEKQAFEREMASVSDEEIAKPEVLDRIEKRFNVSSDEVSKRA